MLEKTLESPLDCREIQPVHPKGDQSWIFIGRTDAEAEAPILWPPDVKSWLIRKDKGWRQEEKGMTEDEMVGWHHQLDGHECEQTLGVGDGQGSLVCCCPWGCKESDMTERLNWSEWSCVSFQCLLGIICIFPSFINGSIIFTLFCTFLHWIYLGLYSILCNDLCEKRI